MKTQQELESQDFEEFEECLSAVEIEKWGRDHYSTLAYIESVCVDHSGMIQNAKMRCNSRLHRQFIASLPTGGSIDSASATMLKNGESQQRHDDWSCLEDMVAEGLVRAWVRTSPVRVVGGGECYVELTELGRRVANELREWKAQGKKFAEFNWEKKSDVTAP